MKNLKAKLRRDGGFTLVEMLIVVAIIAILIAVSIPMVAGALEKTRHAVDQANIRDAAALGALEYLMDENVAKDAAAGPVEYTYYVNGASQGKLAKGNTAPDGYAAIKPSCTCGAPTTELKVKIDKDGNVTTNWIFDTTSDKTTANAKYPT